MDRLSITTEVIRAEKFISLTVVRGSCDYRSMIRELQHAGFAGEVGHSQGERVALSFKQEPHLPPSQPTTSKGIEIFVL